MTKKNYNPVFRYVPSTCRCTITWKLGYFFIILFSKFIYASGLSKQNGTQNIPKIELTENHSIFITEGTVISGSQNIFSFIEYIKIENKVSQKNIVIKRNKKTFHKKSLAKKNIHKPLKAVVSKYKFINKNTEKLLKISCEHLSMAISNTYDSYKAVLNDFFIKWYPPLDNTNSSYQYIKYLKNVSYHAFFFTRPPPNM